MHNWFQSFSTWKRNKYVSQLSLLKLCAIQNLMNPHIQIMSSKRDKPNCPVLQLIFVVVCIGLFFFNVFYTTLDYFDRARIRTQVKQKFKQAHIPEIVVCSKPYFQNLSHHMGTIEQFRENTHDPRNLITKSMMGAEWVREDLYTYIYGWCYHLHRKTQVHVCKLWIGHLTTIPVFY